MTDTVDTTGPGGTSPIPANTFVGTVSDTGPQTAASPTGSVIDGSFQLVDQSGTPVTPTGAVTSVTLSAEGAPGFLAPGPDGRPAVRRTDATPGGGDTGSVLISPLIKPGTTTSTLLQPLQLAADDGGHLPGQQGQGPRQAAGRRTVSGGLDS